jgi:hypothetical protein
MNKLRFALTALAFMAFTLAVSSSAQAQATRTWVSGVGDDVNPCSRTAPCKTYAGAISKTANGGEISVLDPGGYGTLTVTKGITVDGGTGAGWGSTLFSSVNGFVINATANDIIILRNLSMNGAGTTLGVDGVRVLQAKAVNIEDVNISRGSGDGIEVLESSDVTVSLLRVSIQHFTGTGIKVETTAGIAKVSINDSQITNCGDGIFAKRNSRIVVKNSVSSFNTRGVFIENNNNGTAAVVTLESCMIAGNTSHGIQAGGPLATVAASSIARIADNQIINNGGNGVLVSTNGLVNTLVTNEINGNTVNGCPLCTNSAGDIGE